MDTAVSAAVRREKMLRLRDALLSVEQDRAAGRAGRTVDELDAALDSIIQRAAHKEAVGV